MTTQDARPVLAVAEDESPPTGAMLGYAAPRDFERAVFRFVGWVALFVALAQLSLLTLELLQLQTTRLPWWWMPLTGANRWGSFATMPGSWGACWMDGYYPLGQRLLALPLLAGGIGCIRRHARTRSWMLLYAVLATFAELVSLATIVGLMQSPFPTYYLRADDRLPWWLEAARLGVDRLPLLVLPLTVLWLMTRPRAGELFAKLPA